MRLLSYILAERQGVYQADRKGWKSQKIRWMADIASMDCICRSAIMAVSRSRSGYLMLV